MSDEVPFEAGHAAPTQSETTHTAQPETTQKKRGPPPKMAPRKQAVRAKQTTIEGTDVFSVFSDFFWKSGLTVSHHTVANA